MCLRLILYPFGCQFSFSTLLISCAIIAHTLTKMHTHTHTPRVNFDVGIFIFYLFTFLYRYQCCSAYLIPCSFSYSIHFIIFCMRSRSLSPTYTKKKCYASLCRLQLLFTFCLTVVAVTYTHTRILVKILLSFACFSVIVDFDGILLLQLLFFSL